MLLQLQSEQIHQDLFVGASGDFDMKWLHEKVLLLIELDVVVVRIGTLILLIIIIGKLIGHELGF